MIPGTVSKLSEDTIASTTSIAVKTDAIRVTGTTSIATITPGNTGGFSGFLIIVPVDGNLPLLTTGNIAVAVTCAQDRATLLYYSKADSLWYPGAIS